MPHLWIQAPRACHERLDTGPFLRAYSASPPYFAPLTKPRQPLCGRISGLAGAFSPFFSIAEPLRGCLRGRSGRARGPQATGGPGGGTPRRARSALGAGRVGQGGTIRPPLGGTIEGRGSRPKGGGTPQGCPVPTGTPTTPEIGATVVHRATGIYEF